jgi:hypothetical protein|tara:strand:- start:65 stop:2041 length:1977 start_codon:yes stop_codon:yes gene_type:complete
MPPRISKKIEYAGRTLRQDAQQAIRKDIIRALVELITNSDDSYRDLEKAGHKHSGKIIIDVATIKKKKRIRIRDEAEGMSLEKLINILKEYGGTQSSSYSEDGAINRGLFGRGLKDSIVGLGEAKIVSFHAGYYSIVNVNLMKDGRYYVNADSDKPQKNNRKVLQEYKIPFKTQGGLDPHGTIIDLKLNNNIPMPRFDTIQKHLSTHFQLRYIMQNPKRNIQLGDFRKKQKEIEYHPPIGKPVFDNIIKTEKTKINIELEIMRSSVALDAPEDNHPFSQGGLIITTHGIALDNTLFGHGKRTYANHFFGKAEINELFDFLIKDKFDQSILKTSRDGCSWDHPFMKPIKDVILKELNKCIKDFEQEVKKYEKKEMPKELQLKNNKALDELNKIAKLELDQLSDGTLDSDEKETNKRVFCPPEGYGFIPPTSVTEYGKEKYIYFRAKIPEIAKAGDTVYFSSSSEYIEVINAKAKLEPHKDDSSIGQARVKIKGIKIGDVAIMVAKLGDFTAEAIVQVVLEQEKSEESEHKKKKKGLFKDIEFDENAHPDQRVVITDDGILKIARKSDTVRLYFGEGGKPKKENSSLTLLAEIICEAMCNKIAALKFQRGDLPIIGGDLSFENMQYHQNVLESKYSHLIHKIYCSNEVTKTKNTKMVQSI